MTDRTPLEPTPAAHTALTRGGFRAWSLYRWLLKGPVPKTPNLAPPDLWPGDLDRGRDELTEHLFKHRGEQHFVPDATQLPDSAGWDWRLWFHGHGWLRHLKAMDAAEAPYFARTWVNDWIDAHKHYSADAWDAEAVSRRLQAWLTHWDFLVRADASAFQKKLLDAAARDARHLAKSLPAAATGYGRLKAIKGLVFAAHGLFNSERGRTRTLAQFESEVAAQVLADGGHVERNPERGAETLEDLLDVRALLASGGWDVPDWLQGAIDRMCPMLRMMRHPDGGLALFNGSVECSAAWLDQLLVQANSTAGAHTNAPHSGYQRLNGGATHILMDTGRPGGPGQRHHAGTLSFELSVGQSRMIVNCGAHIDGPWHTALAASAAHSTLTVNDTSSAAFALDGKLRRGPGHVTSKRSDNEGGVLVEASHDGYAATFGLMHSRALYLGPGGDDVRGEDRLVGTGGEHYAIRFHLHPGAHASVLAGGQGVLIKLGKKDVWRLRSSIGDIRLEESIYAGRAGQPKRTEQIVITGPLSGNGVLVKWALTREGS